MMRIGLAWPLARSSLRWIASQNWRMKRPPGVPGRVEVMSTSPRLALRSSRRITLLIAGNCSGNPHRLPSTHGTVGGAAAGGALGSAVTGGSTIGTLGGAAIGGYAGHEAGADYDKKHR